MSAGNAAPRHGRDKPVAPAEWFFFDRDRLTTLATEYGPQYRSARPFPFTVMDDFLPAPVVQKLVDEFPTPQSGHWDVMENPVEKKLATTDISALPPFTQQVLNQFNSSTFILFLEALTGITGLIPDPHFVGGGLHQITRGGFLKVHADFNRHPLMNVDRRLNLLLYLNPGWQEEFGGHFELWDRNMERSERRILPTFNRCVVFSTTDHSFHGHPEPLACPEGTTRKSLALYYYTQGRPAAEASAVDHSTLFQLRPGEGLRRDATFRVRSLIRDLTPPIVTRALWRRRERKKIQSLRP